jgi:hypothetical protein
MIIELDLAMYFFDFPPQAIAFNRQLHRGLRQRAIFEIAQQPTITTVAFFHDH